MVRALLLVMVLGVVACNESAPSILVAKIEVHPALDSVQVGSQITFTAIPLAADGSPLLDKRVIWVSGNPAIAAVTDEGVVTGKGPGSTAIRAGSEGAIGSALVVVKGGAVFSARRR